jgi:hypothetical protein
MLVLMLVIWEGVRGVDGRKHGLALGRRQVLLGLGLRLELG